MSPSNVRLAKPISKQGSHMAKAVPKSAGQSKQIYITSEVIAFLPHLGDTKATLDKGAN